MSSKASHFQVAQGAGSAVVALDLLISLNINSCFMLLFISYYCFFYFFYFYFLFVLFSSCFDTSQRSSCHCKVKDPLGHLHSEINRSVKEERVRTVMERRK